MRKMTLLLAIGGMVLSLLLVPTMSAQAMSAQAARADTEPPPGNITIDLKSVNGSGCQGGTTAVAMADDKTAFTVIQRVTAQVGPGAEPTDRRVNCQLSMLAHVPQGFTYAIAAADYRGYAFLATGAWGIEKASYYFQGYPVPAVYRQHRIDGPWDDNFAFTDETPIAALVWAPCGVKRNFNVNIELRVNAGSSDPSRTPSYLTMDFQVYHLAWKHC